jgi:hypothetical protein
VGTIIGVVVFCRKNFLRGFDFDLTRMSGALEGLEKIRAAAGSDSPEVQSVLGAKF